MTDFAPLAPDPFRAAADSTRPLSRASNQFEVKPRPSERLADRVDLSERARFLDELRAMPRVRESVVAGVRNAIQSGSYSIDDKIGLAIERLLDDLS